VFHFVAPELQFFQLFVTDFQKSALASGLHIPFKKGGQYEHANEKNKRQWQHASNKFQRSGR
jgi:hypothetical protein